MDFVQLIQQSEESTLANIRPILPDGGQGRQGIATHGNVVKADNADLSGNGKSLTLALLHNPPGKDIVAAYDGAAAAVQKPLQMQPDGDYP